MKHSMLLLISVLVFASAWTQSPVKMDLNTTSSTIYPGEPVLVSVTLTNPTAQSAERWNLAAGQSLEALALLLKEGKIKQQEYDSAKNEVEAGMKKSSVVTIGSSSRPWTSGIRWTVLQNDQPFALPVEPVRNPRSTDVAVLDGNGFFRAWFTLPLDPKKLPPGRYLVKAELERTSATLMLEVRGESMPVDLALSDSMQLRMGRYYWHSNEPVKGLEQVEKILSSNPSSIDALSLKGDLLLLQNQLQPALDVYIMALEEVKKQFPGSHQVPEYLMESIRYVRHKIEGSE